MTDTAHPIASRVLVETETVRVWDLSLEPGEMLPMHTHSCDYIYVVVERGKTEVVYRGGEIRKHEDHVGDVVHIRRDQGHSLKNIGEKRYRNIVIELKSEGVPSEE